MTARKDRERLAAPGEGSFRLASSVIEAISLPAALVHRDLMIESANRAFGRRLGLKKTNSITGRKWDEIFPAGREEIEDVMRMSRPLTVRVREGWPNDFGTALRDVHISPLTSDGDVEGACIVINETGSLERCEVELARQLAHHLRTPLAIIEMAVEMFGNAFSRGDSARMNVARAIIKHNLDRHRLDIENILGHLRTTRGKRRRISVVTLLRDVLKENKVIMDAMGVRCTMDIDGKLPFIPLVRSDMKRVLSVIIQDAVMSAGGVTVNVRAARKKNNIVISVEGVRAESSGSASALPAGGVRLSTCRGMIESMGGRISPRSRGVSVILPLDNPAK